MVENEIAIVPSGYDPLFSTLRAQSYSKAILLSDENIYPLFGKSLKQQLEAILPTESIVIPAGESTKSVQMANSCWQQMAAFTTDRKSVLIALGGGVITDIGGFVAGCYMRGIDVMHIPTTLLGMVDGAIGGKCGVNLPEGKNLIGLFYPPRLILICLEHLKSLPQREFSSGLAEVIKYGVIYDAEFFYFLEKFMDAILNKDPSILMKIISRSCQIKKEIIKGDERDHNQRRAILNWGHTLGHAIETATKYEVYTHGEAISIGMNYAAKLSQKLGLVDRSFVERQEALFKRAHLPTELPDTIPKESLIELIKLDKKSTHGGISFIVARGFGDVFQLNQLDKDLILGTLNL